MVIAVDFDGTLFSNNYPNIGEPNMNVIEWCKQRKKCGDTVNNLMTEVIGLQNP